MLLQDNVIVCIMWRGNINKIVIIFSLRKIQQFEMLGNIANNLSKYQISVMSEVKMSIESSIIGKIEEN